MNAQTPLISPVALQLAATNVRILRFLDYQGPAGLDAIEAGAQAERKNLRRTLESMVREGLLTQEDATATWWNTEAGKLALRAVDVSAGREPAAPADPDTLQLRHDEIVPNPDQPRQRDLGQPGQDPPTPDRLELDQLKARIVAAGDVLQNLVVFREPEADGRRMLFDGEGRHTAVGELIAEAMWPAERPLRCLLRDRSPGDTAFLALLANSQQPLSKMQEARALQAVCDEKGWSARRAALETGRQPKSVQEALKVLKGASEADIARFEDPDDGYTWKDLLGSVQTPAEADAPAKVDLEEVAGAALSHMAQLGLIELAWKIDRHGFEFDGQRWAQLNGSAYLNETWRTLRDRRFVLEAMPKRYGRLDCIVTLSDSGRDWVSARYPEGVNDTVLAEARTAVGFREDVGAGEDQGYACYFLNDAIGAANIEGARRVREEPTPAEVLALMEIGHAIAVTPDFCKKNPGGEISDRCIIEPTNLNDRLVMNLRWGSLIDCGYDSRRGRSLIRWTDEARTLIAAQGYNGCNEGEISRARAAAALSPDLTHEDGKLVFVNSWLNSRAITEGQGQGNAEAPTGPHVVDGVDYGNATRANEARRAKGYLPPLPQANGGSPGRPANTFGGSATVPAEPTRKLSPIEKLAMAELAHKLKARPEHGTWTRVRKYWLDQAFTDLKYERLLEVTHSLGNGPHASLTTLGRMVMAISDIPDRTIDDAMLVQLRSAAAEASGMSHDPANLGEGLYATPWLNGDETSGALPQVSTSEIVNALGDDDDELDDEEDASAASLLAEVRAVLARTHTAKDVRALMEAVGLKRPFETSDDASLQGVVLTADADEAAVTDSNGELHNVVAQARAELIAYALNLATSEFIQPSRQPHTAAEATPAPLLALHAGDVVSVGGTASGYRLIGRSDHHEPGFTAQQVSLKTGKDVGKPRHVSLPAIRSIVRPAGDA
ncbi:MAG: hypothetical protein JF588_19245 [Caulobacterales bacterium]|nr:hypothetical protein [Caulobacterales bacterium]